MTKNRKVTYLLLIFVVLLSVYSVYKSQTKLTYIEYSVQNDKSDEYIIISEINEELVQEFVMPYDIIYGVSIKIGTFNRDNNSRWKISIHEKDTGKVIYEDFFNGSLIEDATFHLFQFDKNLKLNKNGQYELRISAENVTPITALAFYRSGTSNLENAFYLNNEYIDGDLCFSIYGGDVDYWWVGYSLLIACFFIILVLRAYKIKSKGDKLSNDRIFMSMLIIAIVVLLLNSFANYAGHFSDENDNIRGGFLIAKGKVLYRDYVTQHSPVAYYLCGIFALLGAGSVEQFRLSYYIFEALIWGFIYFRHVKYFGKKPLFMLAILESIVTIFVVNPDGHRILAENFQGICMVVLMLEFLQYYKDKSLDWKRCVIVSLGVWGSLGAIFLSVYALIWLVLMVLGMEISLCIKEKLNFKKIFLRYYKLLISLLTPLICAVVYFKINHALGRAFEQFYTFNREVYPQYLPGGVGSNLIQPFINTVSGYFGIIADNFYKIITAAATNMEVLRFLVVILATIFIVTLFIKKRYLESIILFAVMCGCAPRGWGSFHGVASWYIAIMIIAIFYDEFTQKISANIQKPATCIILIILLNPYMHALGTNLLYKQSAVSEWENNIIDLTEEGEGIIMDAFSFDSIYLLYKDRYPVNCVVYMLPWYMDWYETDTIDDLKNNMPNIVIYYEEQAVWGYTYYSNAFATELKQYYSRLSDDPDAGWKHNVWVKNSESIR